MDIQPQNTEGMQKVGALIGEIGVGMLTWADEAGTLTSRPMLPLALDGDGALWFFTRETPGQTDAEGKVNVAFARPDAATYASVSGRASLVHDAARAAELWNEQVAAWFPDGPQDPELALLRVDVDDAQFWDASASRMVRVPPVRALPALGADVLGEAETGHVTNPQSPSALV